MLAGVASSDEAHHLEGAEHVKRRRRIVGQTSQSLSGHIWIEVDRLFFVKHCPVREDRAKVVFEEKTVFSGSLYGLAIDFADQFHCTFKKLNRSFFGIPNGHGFWKFHKKRHYLSLPNTFLIR
ncbi:hypothetical protein L596_002256 [Steinernema carpocapsae]|uniref:Uncharacterized protein n=1 Tax=Steinernema carpocapsae TaxID=34508 RepID=A0A4U8UNZ6_STECR|nr:hypothetical protein L596_002256 [Steinernema carpocapsae]